MDVKTKSQAVVNACEKYWERNKKDCSGFVKDVAKELGIILTGQANDIVDIIQKSPWVKLSSGVDANIKAGSGMLVICGLKDHPHGHVAIVVPGPLAHGKYPSAYWGSLGGVAKKNTTINWSWNKTDRDKVIYCARVLP